ncbi:hypothetical protein COLO4_31598 [Corchorus olitorius]|uniref:ABC1 atypical kinase-like domain-containing protein n=1 Tax=Corchorus olitorius TaxID=93759 RepID=A0A1R3H438_9ROSI|nr:hypothetical protein COLO4_31598 [Corchorus olitorius]
MSRLLTFTNIRRAAQSASSNQALKCRKYGTVVKVGLRLPQYGLYSHYIYRFNSGGKAPFILHTKEVLSRAYFSGSRSFLSESTAVSHNAQIAWKRLIQTCSASGRRLPHISKIAQAVSLTFFPSHLVISGFFGLTCGKLALAHKTLAETGNYLSQNPPYVHPKHENTVISSILLYKCAQNGLAFVSSIPHSLVKGIILLVRALYLSVLFSPSIIMAPFANSCGSQFRKVWLEVVHSTLEMAGPAFIKLGQWAATRPDLFREDLCNKLSELHSKSPGHTFAYTKKTIERACSRKLSEIFDAFEEEPVASGSIAQVHRASLKSRYPGDQLVEPLKVAVKVRHPGVGESIRRDFLIINFVAKMSKFIPTLNWMRLDKGVQQFANFTMSQVDLTKEAVHLCRFEYNFQMRNDVSFPYPVYPLVHPHVLVESYEQGDGLEGHGRIKTQLPLIGTHAFLKMFLLDNFIIAGMYPQNIVVRGRTPLERKQLPYESRSPLFIFLDVGMTAELSKSDRINLLQLFKAVASRDGHAAAECTLRLSQRQNCPDPKAFIKEVEEAFTFGGTPQGDLVHSAKCMQQLFEKIRRHRVNINGNVCTVIVTALALEGWQRELDPGYDLLKAIKKALSDWRWPIHVSFTIAYQLYMEREQDWTNPYAL